MNENQYQCAMCQGVFDKGWSDEDAKSELERDYPGFKTEDCAIICDDCHKKILKPVSYEEFKKDLRKSVADDYRKMRKDNPAIARLYWKFNREVERKLTDHILYGVPIT